MSGEYRVNKTTGQVIKDDGTGWKPVASVRNKKTGEILIDEGNGWQPMPGSQRNLTEDRGMMLASERANTAFRSNQPIAKDDLARLSKPDFSTAAMARLPAPTMTPQQLDAFDAEQAAQSERLRVPDNDAKERFVIGSNIGTFGHGPQAMAGASTVGALLATPFIEGDIIDREGVSGAMSQFLNEARVHQRRGREERPIESYGGEIIGSFLQGKTLIDGVGKKLLPKTNTASNVTRVAGTGAAYGSLYGLGQSESDTLEGALGDAAFGGALGAGGGLAFKAAEPAVTATYRTAKTGAASLSDALSAALGKAGGARDRVAEDVAIAAVRRSMDRSGMSIDQVMDLVQRYEGKPAVLAEVLGQDAINALTALTRRPGSTPQKAQDLIEERFYGRPDRMKADVEEATGIGIGQLDETLSTQLEARQEAAKPIYDALYKRFNTIKSFGESLKRINRIARTPAMQKHLKLAEEAVKTQAALRQVPISKMSKMEYWDLVKRSLDDEINSAVAKGEARTKVGASVADLTQLKKAITDEFDRLTDGAYAAAREAGGEAPRLKAAAAAGQKALQARNPREVARTVAATLAQDLPALRAGMVDDLGTRIDKGMTPGRVRVPDVAGKLRSGLGEESANKLINRFDAEATLSETGARWAPRMNSVTGTVLESGATQMGDDLVNAGINLATGNKVGLFRQAINFMRTQGFSQRQIDAIGDLLLSSPEEGLKRLRVMKPDGAPTNALGTAAGGAVPPPSGSPTPSPNALAPQGPIRAAGFGGFGGKKPPAERTQDTISREIKDIEKKLRRKGYTLNEAETLAEEGTLPPELRGLMIQHGDLVRESGRMQGAARTAKGGVETDPEYLRAESELNKAMDEVANAEYEIARELRERGLNWEGDDAEFMGVVDQLRREGKLSNYLASRVEDLRAASTRMFDAETKMRARVQAFATKPQGAGALRGDLGSTAGQFAGGALATGAMPVPEDTPIEARIGMALTGGLFAAGGGRYLASRLKPNALADDVATAGAPKTAQQAAKFETPGSPEYEAAKAKGLDMSQAGRMARAKEMGFDTETVLYHGTGSDFQAFDLGAKSPWGKANTAGGGIFLTSKPGVASEYAEGAADGLSGGQVMPLYAKTQNPLVIDMRGRQVSDETIRQQINQAKRAGHDAVILRNAKDSLSPPYKAEASDIHVIFDPSNIRSTNAAFDPDKAASPILTAGFGGGKRPPKSELRNALSGTLQQPATPLGKGATNMMGSMEPRPPNASPTQRSPLLPDDMSMERAGALLRETPPENWPEWAWKYESETVRALLKQKATPQEIKAKTGRTVVKGIGSNSPPIVFPLGIDETRAAQMIMEVPDGNMMPERWMDDYMRTRDDLMRIRWNRLQAMRSKQPKP
jgi:hypothetical protein